MFEGLVRQLLLGYLGQYIKDFQKEQLKITLWNEEVLLENVELILEAFDYLQLPVSLKRGRIGRLSIRIPWKKLGWDPIIILLEDVFFFAGPRDDAEWSADIVERRELAAKKAKLATAELAKLSRRVSDNQAGLSLISHVTGRILDSIQVSMRNVHILFGDMQSSMLCGLRFSSLTIAKQAPIGSSSTKSRGGQVSKIVEIHGLGIHCSRFQGSFDCMGADSAEKSQPWLSALTDAGGYDYMLVPFDLSLLVIKSGKLEHDAPQYSITAELTRLVMTINPAQLQHILEFSDYICICQLREKYGRYRPLGCPLSKKSKGWPKIWWRYAQESVLYDVRKKLKKISWRYLGQRLHRRRKYVNLYKVKLDLLRKEQPLDQDVLFELELMEKDSDIDDILQFRAIAERELEDSLKSTFPEMMESSATGGDKLPNDEAASGKARGWLNWLSRGVLGAGGTEDSSQFSGVVSDEVIKDICEATKFQPVSSVQFATSGTMFLFALNFSIEQISLFMNSSSAGQEIAVLSCNAAKIECKVWEDSTAIIAKVGSVEFINSLKQMAVLQMEKGASEKGELLSGKPSTSIQVDVSPENRTAELIVRVIIQPIEIYCDLMFLLQLMEFYRVIESHKSLQQRVIMSLNDIEDVRSRLLSKKECVLSGRQRMIWDVNFVKISISLPWDNMDCQPCSLVTHIRGLWFSSKFDYPRASEIDDKHEIVSEFLKMKGALSVLNALELRDMYDHYDLNLDDLQITLMTPHFPHGLSVVEKFCASVSLDCCIIPDEMELKQLEANFVISSLQLQFSASVYCAILSLVDRLHLLASESEQGKAEDPLLPRRTGSHLTMPFFCSLVANFKAFKLELNLEDDGDSSSILQLCVQDLNLRYAQNGVQDCWVSAKAVNIISYKERNECKRSILCSSRLPVDTDFAHPREMQKQNADNGEQDKLFDRCFRLHYGYNRIGHLIRNICTIHLSNTEFHCYPDIVRSLVGFCDKVMACDRSRQYGNSFSQMESKQSEVSSFGFQRFGLSNFYEDEFAEWASIPVDQFPFITMRNSGGLHKFENAIIPEWRSLNIREKNITSLPNFEILMPELKVSDESDRHLLGSPDTSFLHLAVNILSINVDFHDASCIVGSITLPAGKASVTSHSGSCDVLCSVEGLRLFSSWWTYKFQEFLWGPSQPNLSPVLNIRVRRGVCRSSSDLEISFGIQHVCCVVPPDYLAVLIGYFSLPDWSSTDNEHQFTENGGHISESDATVYNFEILDSIIMSPVESNENQFLKLDAHLCCSFIHNDTIEKASNDIFSEFSVPVDKVAGDVHSLDIFGRNSCLSSLLLKDDGSDTLPSDEITKHDNHILVPSFSFDIWIRLPNDSKPSQMSSSTCIMMNLTNCEIVAEVGIFCSDLQT